jgi:imidazolonepropionase-like amidohydrolase
MRKEEAEAQAQGRPMPKRPAPPRPPEPARDAIGEAFLPVLEGSVRLRVWAEREEEIRLALSLGREYGISLVVCGAVEAYRVAKELAEARAQVVLFPRPAGYVLGKDVRPSRGNAKALFDAGVQFGFGTGTRVRSGAYLLRHFVACEVANGLDPEYALRTITLTNAEIAGVAERIGSIGEGKDANLVVFDGAPFATASKVLCAIVAGKIVVQEQGGNEDGSKS